jgi:hypothetical protein
MYSIVLPVAEGKNAEGSADLVNQCQIVIAVSIKAVEAVVKDAKSSADLANGQYSHGHSRQSKGC